MTPLCLLALLFRHTLAATGEGSLTLRGSSDSTARALAGAAPSADCPEICIQTINSIHKAEDQVVSTLAMTLNFLLVAVGVEKESNTERMDYYITKFYNYHKYIRDGNSDPAYNTRAAPDAMQSDLTEVYDLYYSYKKILENNVAAVNNTYVWRAVFSDIEYKSKKLLNAVDGLVAKYYGYAEMNNYQMPPESELMARRQLSYIEKMMKEALFIGLNFNQAKYAEDLLQSERLFQESHATLVYGNQVAGVDELNKMCTLHAMLEVEHYWGDFKTNLKQIKDNQVFAQLFLDQHLGFIAENAADPQLKVALKQFKSAWNNYASTDAERMAGLQTDYIDLNPLADKIDLDKANGTQSYHAVHGQYHPIYRTILLQNNYYDIFFLDVVGNCIYSVYKEADFATNFDEHGIGEWKDSGLGEAFVAARDAPDEVHIIDWKPYGPSAGAMASFLAQGIKENGQLIGVFVTQMPPESEPALADPQVLKQVDYVRTKLETELYNALDLYTVPQYDCTPADTIKATQWGNALAETSKQRMLTQKVARMYYLFVKGIDEDRQKVDMRALLLEGTASVRKCIAGSYFDGVPAPPSQHIVEELLDLWHEWQLMEESMSMSFENNDKTLVTMSQIAALAESCLAIMSKIGEALVYESLEKIPSLRSVVIEIADRQSTILEKMSKEALLVSVDEEFEKDDTVNYGVSVDAFLASHEDLLVGRHAHHDDHGHRRLAASTTAWTLVPNLFTDLDVARTTDSCTLNQMVSIRSSFDKLHEVTSMIVGNKSEASDHLLGQVSHLVDEALEDMEVAAGFYVTGSGTCDVHYKQNDWETILQESLKLSFLFQKAQTEFALVASGMAATWEANAQAALTENEGFIAENARDPLLAEVAAAFKEGWNKFRSTDAERRMGLQVAYITMNPNPAGSKDILDYAEGSEEYHASHKKYHPTYRALLYEKNYYDIFILDLAGNCIYSVYKELDFATNFDPAGEGEWKDSGLGEAYVEGMANPDTINVIDWKPYGPSAGALASFLSTGIRNAAGNLIGIYVTQMHPDSKPIDSPAMLASALHDLDGLITSLKFGDADHGIRPPPTQQVANALFTVVDHWAILEPMFHAEHKDKESTEAITSEDTGVGSFSSKLTAYTQAIVDGAWQSYKELQGTRVKVAGDQLALVQSMCRDVVLLGMGARGASVVQLRNKMNEFDANQILLENGGTASRRLQATKDEIVASEDPMVLELMQSVDAIWAGEGGLKSLVQPIAEGSLPTDASLRSVVETTSAAEQTIEASFDMVATSTRTTTMLELEILAPMPFTGDWSAGRTMKVASLLAESLINSDQLILPGFRIKTVFFDDKCDPTSSSQVVLRETSAKPTYVALGGAGCSDVCAETAFVAETILLPFVSYECSASYLSNTIEYPSLVRFGTVTGDALNVLVDMVKDFGWGKVFVVTGDQSVYRADADAQRALLDAEGITSEYVSAVEYNFDEIVAMMAGIKETSKGANRVLYVMGTESYYRKVLCASIIAGVRQGVTWFSIGTQRHEWWTKTDSKTDFQYSWLRGDVAGSQIRNVLQSFKTAWDAWGGPDHTQDLKMEEIQAIYRTDMLENFDGPAAEDGEELYHSVHRTWHPIYRSIMLDREYYDIFVFDLQGNLIYSVFKEADFATNFAAGGTGRWRTSGLGEAFEMAKGDPFNVSYVDWRPYGPSGDAPAAFLSTGVANAEGVPIGVYAIQLPPTYQKSIEEQQEECTLEGITAAYEGAINVAGLGRPVLRDMEKPLPCFKGHSASSFISLLDEHLELGFPRGDVPTQVPSPYHEVKANAADATCAIAMVLRELHFNQGYSMAQIQRPSDALYAEYIRVLKNLDFDGASGRVKFEEENQQNQQWEKGGNEKRNNLVVLQVQEGVNKEIGLVRYLEADPAEKIQWQNGGVMNVSWTQEFVDPPQPEEYFPWFLFQIVAPISIICVPITIGAVRYTRF